MSFIFTKPNRPVSRVFIHCSASDNPEHDNAATMDRLHRERGWSGIGYHLFIRKSALVEDGRDLEKVPAAQGGNNTRTIAICLHGLAVDKFTQEQFDALRDLCDQINRAYQGNVTFHGHCEVANKTCPVFDYRNVLGLDMKGRMPMPMRPMGWVNTTEAAAGTGIGTPDVPIGLVKFGDRGPKVRVLQQELKELGYQPGAIDGIFGKLLRDAVMALQADHDLVTDGKVGPVTAEAIAAQAVRALAPERTAASLLSLAGNGSRIATASVSNGLAGLTLTGGGVLALVNELSGKVDEVNAIAGPLAGILSTHGPLVGGGTIAVGLFVAWQSWRSGSARVQDHRSGKTL
ncbi:N-acetylmuramoyl-L-alanine amidase [Puniceibacterium antarcticum]|uniref:N-acetylmuramoyl-L-alanine amidase n=1 Tax=Puniceibacterium antarcticum TaxID=1206336 RepID=A0A2G8RET1_9RHOB|nr:peptidoglycan-binding domain-containing protein [Puniceibacterium antarcticum]PIL20094.1 N-acetylmuramoyl-L-alanine amidase [Puniceibacterium antarcticum]